MQLVELLWKGRDWDMTMEEDGDMDYVCGKYVGMIQEDGVDECKNGISKWSY